MIADHARYLSEPWGLWPVEVEGTFLGVDVWITTLDRPRSRIQELMRLLSLDERSRGRSFRLKRDKDRFIVRRGLLRVVLGRYLDTEPARLEHRYTPYGKPFIGSTYAERALSYSISHSDRLAVYAVATDREVGVDIERVRPLADARRIANRFFSTRERAALRGLPTSQRLHGFFNCWTRKEAYLKARGCGLFGSMREFTVSLAPGEPARLLVTNEDPTQATCWSLTELPPTDGYVAALCVDIQPSAATVIRS